MWYVTISVSVIFSILNPLPMILASISIHHKFKSSSKKITKIVLVIFIVIVFLTAIVRIISVIYYLIVRPFDELEPASAMLVTIIPDFVPLFFTVWYVTSCASDGKNEDEYHAVSDGNDTFQ